MNRLRDFDINRSITGVFILNLLVILILIFIANMYILGSIFFKTKIGDFSPADFTRKFQAYIAFDGKTPYVNEEGKRMLSQNNGWIQILNNNFSEVYNIDKPDGVPASYTPVSITHIYKYDISGSSVFIGEKIYEGGTFSYIIGFPISHVAKYNIEYNPSEVRKILGSQLLIMFAADILIVLISSYIFFGKKMGRPLRSIINGIDSLSKGCYDKKYNEHGIYKNVFFNMNKLGRVLNENRIERERIDRMRDDWISYISHDIKTPLSSIKGYAEIMNDDCYEFTKDEIRDYSSIIYDKASYIQSLIDELNMTFKLKSKTFPLQKRDTDIVLFIKNVIIEILNHPKYHDRNIVFHDPGQAIMLPIDKNLFKRAFSNLIVNALTHNSEETTIDISVYKDNNVFIVIKDNGKGIKPEDLKYIFERYYRGTNTGASSDGSGLGMTIAKQVIDAHGGSICVESAVENGTTVTITL